MMFMSQSLICSAFEILILAKEGGTFIQVSPDYKLVQILYFFGLILTLIIGQHENLYWK